MITANELIKDAFDDIGVKPAEVELTDSEQAVGLRRLNRLGTAFAADGLNFGYTKLTSVNQEVTIPDWAEDLFITYLAIRLAPAFGMAIDPALVESARNMYKIAVKTLGNIPETYYPNTLPKGAGNDWDGSVDHFFNDTDENYLTSGADRYLTDDESVVFTTE